MRNKLVLVAIAAVALPLLALTALYLFVNPERLKPVVEAQLTEALQRPTGIESLAFHVFPPSFSATGLTVADDPAFSKQPFLTAKSVDIRPALLPLLSGNVHIDALRVSEPRVELIENAAARWNYSSLGKQEGGSSSTAPSLASLNIDNANVSVTRPDSPRETYTDISGELRDYAPGKPFHLRISARRPQGETVSAEGTVENSPDRTALRDTSFTLASLKGKIDGEVNGKQLNFNIQVPSSPLADLAPLFLPKSITAKGQLSANITLTGTRTEPQLNGRIDVTGFEVSGGDIKQPVKTAKLGLAMTPERISLEPADIASGSTRLQAFGVVSKYATDPTIDATLLAPAAQLPELLAIARAYGLSAVEGIEAKGQAKIQVRAHGSLKSKAPLQFAGSGSLRDAAIQLPSLTKPLTIQSTDFRFESDSASLSNIDATIGSTHATGDLKISNFRYPGIVFDLQAAKVNVDELSNLAKSGQSSAPPKLTAQGKLAAETLEVADLTLSKLQSQANYKDGKLTLNPLNAQLYGGRHAGSMDIDLRAKPPLYSLNSRLEKIDSAQLLAAATAVKGIISGPLSANLNLRFSPADPLRLARSLNGNVSLKFDQGRIASFNLTKELATLAKFFGVNASGDRFTQFAGIAGDLAIVNGLASTQNLKVDLSNLSASLTGTMNLVDETLNMKMLSVLDRRFSDQVGGNKVGGFMTVAFGNSNGNLMIPALITGTFTKPAMAPDPTAIAKMKLQSFSPKDPKQMMDSVNSVIDLFKKKKP